MNLNINIDRYIEAQMFGRIDLNDIAAIEIQSKNFAETESSLTIAEKRKWLVAYYKQITTGGPPEGLSAIHCFRINKDGKVWSRKCSIKNC